jgi:hypothetical protein
MGIHRIKIAVALIVTCFLANSDATSQESGKGQFRYAAQTLEISGEVVSAYMLFSTEVGVQGIVPAAVLRMVNRKSIIIVSGYRDEGSPGAILVTGIVISKDGGIVSHTTPIEEAGLEGISTMNPRELTSRLEAARVSLTSLEKDRETQAQDLERLQEDADTIANIGRIVDAEDELGAIKSDEQRLTASIAAIKAQLAILKAQSIPANYQRREAELSAFLTNFSRASRDSNSEAFKKLAAAEDEAARNLALIEESKFEHVDLLQKELISLRKEREAVERSRQVVVADRDGAGEFQGGRPPELRREVPAPEQEGDSGEDFHEKAEENDGHGTSGE